MFSSKIIHVQRFNIFKNVQYNYKTNYFKKILQNMTPLLFNSNNQKIRIKDYFSRFTFTYDNTFHHTWPWGPQQRCRNVPVAKIASSCKKDKMERAIEVANLSCRYRKIETSIETGFGSVQDTKKGRARMRSFVME